MTFSFIMVKVIIGRFSNRKGANQEFCPAEIRFYLHKEFRAAGIRVYLHKDCRAAGIRFDLHKGFRGFFEIFE